MVFESKIYLHFICPITMTKIYLVLTSFLKEQSTFCVLFQPLWFDVRAFIQQIHCSVTEAIARIGTEALILKLDLIRAFSKIAMGWLFE